MKPTIIYVSLFLFHSSKIRTTATSIVNLLWPRHHHAISNCREHRCYFRQYNVFASSYQTPFANRHSATFVIFHASGNFYQWKLPKDLYVPLSHLNLSIATPCSTIFRNMLSKNINIGEASSSDINLLLLLLLLLLLTIISTFVVNLLWPRHHYAILNCHEQNVAECIKFRTLILTLKLYIICLLYLQELISLYRPSSTLRSSTSLRLNCIRTS